MEQHKRFPKSKSKRLSSLKTTHAGIDIGSAEIFVCIATSASEQVVRSFSTFTPDLKQMVKWLCDSGVKTVAMESTGVYWIPTYELLEEHGIEPVLVNAKYFKNAPGRKTDVVDCQWLQELHSYGLLQGSFRPENDYVVLRSYVRQRSRLYQHAATQANLMHKALAVMNLQITNVISDITGLTGLKIIRSILAGERDPKKLAELRHGRCHCSKEDVAKALEGNYRLEHIFALKQAYEGYEFFHQQVLACEKIIEQTLDRLQAHTKGLEPEQLENIQITPRRKSQSKTEYNRTPYFFDPNKYLTKLLKVDLTEIPGIDTNVIVRIISEIGTDMSRWKTSRHFCSWLGLCPNNKISGGKILSSRTKPTKNRVAEALRLAANTLCRSKSALGAYFRRMRSRLGAPKAITAAAHKLARTLYRMLSDPQKYKEYGENYYEEQYKDRVLKKIKRQAQELGYDLTLKASTT